MCGLLRLYSAISLFLIFRMFLFMRLINVVNASYRSVILLSPLLVEISTNKIIAQKCGNVNKFFDFMPKNLIAALEAGICINNSSVTIVHGMSRPIGALFHGDSQNDIRCACKRQSRKHTQKCQIGGHCGDI